MTSKGGNMKLTPNVALSFLSEVKKRFEDEKGKYEDFVEIMKGFMARRIDIANVIARVKELFNGDRELILGFNAFLPKEYVITVPREDEPTPPRKPVRFGDAMGFINKIKMRFEGNENVYRSFLHILDMYGKQTKTIKEVNQEVVSLFGDQIDLIEEFGHFLPGPSGQPSNNSPHSKRNHISHHNYRSSSVSAMRTGRAGKAAASHDGRHFNVDEPDPNFDRFAMGISKDLHRKSSTEMERRDGSQWRKRKMDDRDCDYGGGVHRASPICKSVPEIEEPDQFYQGAYWKNEHVPISVKVYSRHKDQNGGKRYKDRNHENRAIERPDRLASGGKDESVCNISQFPSKDELLLKPINELDLSNCERCTPSYRLLPKDYPIPSASRRKDADAKVLNDYWVSVTSGSEDYSFKHMRKNQYEESLFHCEDDRYELDMLLESVKAARRSVEELLEKINDNTIEISSIHIEDHFTGLNLRCIERVYGDHGLDVMDILRKNPPLTLEVIIHRLKQKQEEWTRCRSDYSKVWAQIYAKNYHRSLDHRSFYFKQEELKRLSSKAMADIPDIFGGPQVSIAAKTNPKTTKDPSQTQEGVSRRQKHSQSPEDTQVVKNPPVSAATKPTSSRIFNAFGKIGYTFISEAEYKRWMAKSREEKQALATRASLELLLFNIEQSKESQSKAARMKELEDKIAKLKLDVTNTSSKVTKLESTNTTLKKDLARLQELGKEKDKSIAELEEKNTDLQLEVEELKGEKDKIKEEAFGDGIRRCCKIFLAGEPSYDWSVKFGKSMAGYMADLAEKEAEAIAEKRTELAQMVANEAEDLARQQNQDPPADDQNTENATET